MADFTNHFNETVDIQRLSKTAIGSVNKEEYAAHLSGVSINIQVLDIDDSIEGEGYFVRERKGYVNSDIDVKDTDKIIRTSGEELLVRAVLTYDNGNYSHQKLTLQQIE